MIPLSPNLSHGLCIGALVNRETSSLRKAAANLILVFGFFGILAIAFTTIILLSNGTIPTNHWSKNAIVASWTVFGLSAFCTFMCGIGAIYLRHTRQSPNNLNILYEPLSDEQV